MGQGRGQKSQQSLITILYTYPQCILLTNCPSKYLISYGGESTFDMVQTVSRFQVPKISGYDVEPGYIAFYTTPRPGYGTDKTWTDLQEQILYILQILWLMNNLSIAFKFSDLQWSEGRGTLLIYTVMDTTALLIWHPTRSFLTEYNRMTKTKLRVK